MSGRGVPELQLVPDEAHPELCPLFAAVIVAGPSPPDQFVGEAVEKVRGERGEEGQAEEVADSIRNGRQELSSRLCEGATGMGH